MNFRDLIAESKYTFDMNPLIQDRFNDIRKAIDEGVEEATKLYLETLGWLRPEKTEDLQCKLATCELDLQHCEAVIDGSWPNADDWIKTARERRKP